MKKTILCLAIILFSLGVSAYALEEGDYVSFGKYGGEPIIWRVLEGDADGYFVIADKILCFKPLDALSGNWKTSSLRSWLNSAEDTVTYLNSPQAGTQINVNPYHTEKGFLSAENFSTGEVQMLKDCARDVIGNNQPDSALTGSGETGAASDVGYRKYIRNPQTAGVKAEGIYMESVSDKVFLPSVSDIQHMALSHDIFGVEYQVGSPTAYAAEHAATSDAAEGRGCYYWLGDALFFSKEGNHTYVMAPNNVVSYARSYNGLVGVRPMCRIINEKFYILSGEGSADAPYRLNTDKGIHIQADKAVVMKGDTINVTVNSSFDEGVVYEVYQNGVKCSSNTVKALAGDNEIYYKVFSAEGTLLGESNTINILGLSYEKLTNILSNDFENDNLFQGFVRCSAAEGYAKGVTVDAQHGVSLEAKSGNGNSVTAAFPNFSHKNSVAIEFEFMLPETDVIQNNLVNLKINGSGQWISPLAVKDGRLILEDISSDCSTLPIAAGQWYQVAMYIDQEQPSLTVAVSENGVTHVLCYKASWIHEVDCFAYGEITSTGNSTGRENTVYFDNISVYTCIQGEGTIHATEVIIHNKAELNIYNPGGEAEELMAFGIVKENGRLIECKMENVALSESDDMKNVSFQFENKGEIRCIVLRKNISPIRVRPEK